MKKINIILPIITALFFLNSCIYSSDDENEFDFVTFEDEEYVAKIGVDSEATFAFTLFTSKIYNSDRAIQISVNEENTTADPDSYNIPSSITVPAGTNIGELSIDLNDIGLGGLGEGGVEIGEGKVLTLSLKDNNDLSVGHDLTIKMLHNCPTNTVQVVLWFSTVKEGLSWDIKDSSDVVIASGGGYTDENTPSVIDGDPKGHVRYNLCLDSDTYTMTVYNPSNESIQRPGNVFVYLEDGDEYEKIFSIPYSGFNTGRFTEYSADFTLE